MTKSIGTARPASLVCALLLLLLTPRAAAAYDNDTHFWLTYYLAVEAGYSPTQATQIASANIGVDFDEDTEPLTPWKFDDWKDLLDPQSHFQHRRINFHALPLEAIVRGTTGWWNPTKLEEAKHLGEAKRLVDERKDELWRDTLKEMENPGVFLHYFQDISSHKGFTSYIGHAGYSYVDFLASDPESAKLMARETFKYLLAFRAALEGKEFPDLQRPENLQLGDEQVRKIEQAVEAFCEANPVTGGIVKNKLVTRWENSDDKARRAYRIPSNPISYLFLMFRIKGNAPAPDSAKSRRVVQELLGLGECELPHIWLYDFNGSGKVAIGHRAKKAKVYVPYRSKNRVFIWGDEEKNTRERKVKVNGQRRCLSYCLEDENPFDCGREAPPSPCDVRRAAKRA